MQSKNLKIILLEPWQQVPDYWKARRSGSNPVDLISDANSSWLPSHIVDEQARVVFDLVLKADFEPYVVRPYLPVYPSTAVEGVLKTTLVIEQYFFISIDLREANDKVLWACEGNGSTFEFDVNNDRSASVPVQEFELRASSGHSGTNHFESGWRISKHESGLFPLLSQLTENKISRYCSRHKSNPAGGGRKPVLQSAPVFLANVTLKAVTRTIDERSKQHHARQNQKRQNWNVKLAVVLQIPTHIVIKILKRLLFLFPRSLKEMPKLALGRHAPPHYSTFIGMNEIVNSNYIVILVKFIFDINSGKLQCEYPPTWSLLAIEPTGNSYAKIQLSIFKILARHVFCTFFRRTIYQVNGADFLINTPPTGNLYFEFLYVDLLFVPVYDLVPGTVCNVSRRKHPELWLSVSEHKVSLSCLMFEASPSYRETNQRSDKSKVPVERRQPALPTAVVTFASWKIRQQIAHRESFSRPRFRQKSGCERNQAQRRYRGNADPKRLVFRHSYFISPSKKLGRNVTSIVSAQAQFCRESGSGGKL
ncbi:hypothetical protein [Agrobacterium sp. 22117]|uniref:hypothetical protein n=1 Tax=Agrobacterium sp. 22117 TaxID=3453880 RepID=UPI003F849688